MVRQKCLRPKTGAQRKPPCQRQVREESSVPIPAPSVTNLDLAQCLSPPRDEMCWKEIVSLLCSAGALCMKQSGPEKLQTSRLECVCQLFSRINGHHSGNCIQIKIWTNSNSPGT